MGIVSITERFTGNQTTQESPDALHYSLSSTRVLDILVDDPPNWDSFLISAALSDPQIRSAYPDDFWLPAAACRFRSYRRSGTSRQPPMPFTRELGLSPLSLPAIISYHTVLEEYDTDIDINGNPIHCITGEDFDPPVRINTHDRMLRITEHPQLQRTVGRPVPQCRQLRPVPRVSGGNGKWQHAGRRQRFGFRLPVLASDGQFQIRFAFPLSTDAKAWYARRQARLHVQFQCGHDWRRQHPASNRRAWA